MTTETIQDEARAIYALVAWVAATAEVFDDAGELSARTHEPAAA